MSPQNGNSDIDSGSPADPITHEPVEPIHNLESVGPYRIRERLGVGGMGAAPRGRRVQQRDEVSPHTLDRLVG